MNLDPSLICRLIIKVIVKSLKTNKPHLTLTILNIIIKDLCKGQDDTTLSVLINDSARQTKQISSETLFKDVQWACLLENGTL